MSHARRFGGVDDDRVVGADRHSFGLDADWKFAHNFARCDVDRRQKGVVFIGDEHVFAISAHAQLLWIGP
jgi:hypothetical protein